jgi:23S rRNA (pseudouridine1915-N3)-methyltransferase
MKLHIITIGEPKLPYARLGWDEYFKRIGHYYSISATHIPDKHNDSRHIFGAAEGSFLVALATSGTQFTSEQLAQYLQRQELHSKTLSLAIGGPDGLPQEVMRKAGFVLSLSELTFQHDLAMVVLLESIYRACTINAGIPYHK